MPRLDFNAPAVEVARALVGAMLFVDGVGGRIVETEAYDQSDPASHSFAGRTARNAAMFGPPGRAYVYRSYGLHWCLNAVCTPAGHGAGVLIRALEPTAGLDVMRERLGVADARLLCSGPGRLCMALGVTGELNGARLDRKPFRLAAHAGVAGVEVAGNQAAGVTAGAEGTVAAGRRIGISKAREQPWRFVLAGSAFLSRPLDSR